MSRRNFARSSRTRRLARGLSAYAAGGMSLAAVDASAGIVYTDLGPNSVSVTDGAFDLDLNQDGVTDFTLVQESVEGGRSTSSGCTFFSSFSRETALVRGQGANQLLADDLGALNLASLAQINPAASGFRQAGLLAQYDYRWWTNCSDSGTRKTSSAGRFATFSGDPVRGFLGLKFDIDGSGPHAAWADVEASPYEIILHGFAYETTPGKSITAGAIPEPPSLALLAAGATGLAALRKKRGATIRA